MTEHSYADGGHPSRGVDISRMEHQSESVRQIEDAEAGIRKSFVITVAEVIVLTTILVSIILKDLAARNWLGIGGALLIYAIVVPGCIYVHVRTRNRHQAVIESEKETLVSIQNSIDAEKSGYQS